MASGALAVMRGVSETRFSFDEEPGEFRWILKKLDSETYSFTILVFDELWGNEPDEVGEVAWQRTVSRTGFAKMVLTTLENVRQEYGDEGYKERWSGHDFPVAELMELRTEIAKINP